MATMHEGGCFCGAVWIRLSGEPEAMVYCHCTSCRSWSGSPVHASTMWKADAVEVAAGAEHVRTFHKTPQSSHRQYCGLCGGPLMIHHPDFGMYDVLPATIPTLQFVPIAYVNSAIEKVVVTDSLRADQVDGWGPTRVVRRAAAREEVAAVKELPGAGGAGSR